MFELGISNDQYEKTIQRTTSLYNEFYLKACLSLKLSNREDALCLYYFMFNTFHESFFHHIVKQEIPESSILTLLSDTLAIFSDIRTNNEVNSILSGTRISAVLAAKKYEINENSVVDFGLGMRHDLFKLLKIYNIPGAIHVRPNEINKITNQQELAIQKSVYAYANRLNFNGQNQDLKHSLINILSDLIRFSEYNITLFPNCLTILTSAHGWVGSNIIRFILSQAKAHYNSNILIMQAGLIHQSGTQLPQVLWEKMICNKWLSWSDDASLIDSKCEFIGSPYIGDIERKTNQIEDKSNIFLPQVPSSLIRRPFPFYWQLSASEFHNQIENMLDELDYVIKTARNPVLRVKSCDKEFYERIMHNRYPDLPIDSGNINNSEFSRPAKTTFVSYFSTAIIESVFYSDHMSLLFSTKDTFLKKDVYTEKNKNYSFDEIKSKAVRYTSYASMKEKLKTLIH